MRKCLITHGEIETAMTSRIGALLQEGRSQKEICGMLGISSSCVNANSPYERGIQIEPSQTVFQSTHPVRGATQIRKGYKFPTVISIHAPLTGCDVIFDGPVGQLFDFNPRTPHGVRRGMGRRCLGYWDFNPRTPHGVRRPPLAICGFLMVFQSTHPSRGATNYAQVSALTREFQPTHPSRGATAAAMMLR